VLQLDDAVPVQGVLVLGEACAHEGGDARACLIFGSWLILETGWQTRYRKILSPKLEISLTEGVPDTAGLQVRATARDTTPVETTVQTFFLIL
jgi:hypothetical protein